MEDTRLMVCDRCRRSVPIADIRYMSTGKETRTALCSACRNRDVVQQKANVEKVKTILKKVPFPDMPQTRTVKKAVPTGPKIEEFFCSRCRYKFKLKDNNANLKCPYCGKSDKVKECANATAEKLVDTFLDE